MSPRLRATLVVALVFVLGAVTGSYATRFYAATMVASILRAPREEGRRRTLLWVLDRRLSLSRAQRAEIDAVLKAHDAEVTEVRHTIDARIAPLAATISAEIRAKLTDEQRPAFDELSSRFATRFAPTAAPVSSASAGPPR